MERHFGTPPRFSHRPQGSCRDSPGPVERRGPAELITWGRGYACVLSPPAPRWLPAKHVTPYHELGERLPGSSTRGATPRESEEAAQEPDDRPAQAATWEMLRQVDDTASTTIRGVDAKPNAVNSCPAYAALIAAHSKVWILCAIVAVCPSVTARTYWAHVTDPPLF